MKIKNKMNNNRLFAKHIMRAEKGREHLITLSAVR